MAVATTAAIATGVAVAGGVAKAVSGRKMMRDAQREARNYRRQQLRNVNEGRRISTVGAEFTREGIAANIATGAEALRSGGVRGVVGGMGRMQAGATAALQQEAAQLDQQQVQLDRDIAMDDARIRQMQEDRENMDLYNLQQQVNAGQQTMFSGMGDVAQAGFGMASMLQQNQLNQSEINLNNERIRSNRFLANPKVNALSAGPHIPPVYIGPEQN